MRKSWLAGLALALGLAGTAAAQEKVVKIYNWSDYIDPSVLTDFTAKTGIKVVYDVYDTNEVLEAKLLAGSTGYDLVVPTAHFLARQIQAGIFRRARQLQDPELEESRPEADGGGRQLRPGQRARRHLHVGHHRVRLQRRRRSSSACRTRRSTPGGCCSIPRSRPSSRTAASMMLDASDDMIAAALNYLGLDPNSKDQADLEKAQDVLMKVRPYVRKFHSSGGHQRAGQRRHLPRHDLLGRRRHRRHACRGGEERHRDQVQRSRRRAPRSGST